MTAREDLHRRIIDVYRMKLLEVDERACDAVDARVASWGAGWVSDNELPDLDIPLSARDIAEKFGISVHNVRDWARRHPDKITKHKRGTRIFFVPREILACKASA